MFLMKNSKKKFFGIPGGLFLVGILFLFLGTNGEQYAIKFSKPNNTTSWATPDSLINTFTYVPMIIGISLIILSISTFLVSYYNWQRKR